MVVAIRFLLWLGLLCCLTVAAVPIRQLVESRALPSLHSLRRHHQKNQPLQWRYDC